MSGARGAELQRVGLVSSVGLSAPVAAAAVQAGINRFSESSILDRRFHPVVMALVATPDLPPLAPALEAVAGLTARQMRMLRLAGPALVECLEGGPERPLPLLLAGPEALPVGRPAPAGAPFLGQLAKQAGRPIDAEKSKVFPAGRAGVFQALAEALEGLAARRYDHVVVGGVDTCLDLYLLGTLDMEERIHAASVSDGLIPGEGAAFLMLGRPGAGAALARIEGVGTAEEAGHRYNKDVPYRGEGLDAAVRAAFAAAPGEPVRTVFAGFNGENFFAKEWGVAVARHKKRLVEDFVIEHPADCVGDAGAALGAMMVGLAALALAEGQREARCLVWGSSDLEARGAAVMDKG
jgi:3-oxoacyl-[acyl-carrier-protein] synthase-1